MTGATRHGVARGTGELPTGGCVPRLGPQTLTQGGDGLGTGKPQSAVWCLVPRGRRLDCAAIAPGSAPQPPAHSITASNDTANVESRKHPHWGFPSLYSTGSSPQITALLCDHEVLLQKGQQVARRGREHRCCQAGGRRVPPPRRGGSGPARSAGPRPGCADTPTPPHCPSPSPPMGWARARSCALTASLCPVCTVSASFPPSV